MKCKFIKPMKLQNPMWSDADASAAARAKVPYHVPQQINVEAGFVIEDDQAWIHCCPGEFNAPAIAVPADDECIEAVRVWMEEKRPKQIALIKAQVEQIHMIKDPRDKQHLLAMAEAYGLLPGQKKVPAESPKAATGDETTSDVPDTNAAASPEPASPAADDDGVPDAGHI